MVEQIYDQTMLLEELKNHNRMSIVFTLDSEEIEEWKQNGNFAFIKKELINLPKAKFACVQYKDGRCSYHFILNTKKLTGRVLTMIRKIFERNEHVSLVRCDHIYEYGNRMDSTCGLIKACPLF